MSTTVACPILSMSESERRGSLRESLDCFICNKSYTDKQKIILCGRCGNNFCMVCAEMTTTRIAHIKDPTWGVIWFCRNCQKPAAKSIKTDKEIEERCKDYCERWDKRITELEQKLDSKAEKGEVDRLTMEVDRLNIAMVSKAEEDDIVQLREELTVLKSERTDFTKEVQQAVERELQDWKEKEKRRTNNIII